MSSSSYRNRRSVFAGIPLDLGISAGYVSGVSGFLISSHLPDLDTSETRDIWEGPDNELQYLTSAEKMNVKSTSTDDTSAGDGVRTVLLSGLDGELAEVSEIISMNGTSDVLSSNTYLRVRSIAALTVGVVNTSNAGEITATAASAATEQCHMAAGEGVSKNIHFTVPAGKVGSLPRLEFSATKVGGSSPVVEFKGQFRRNGAAPWIQVFDKKIDTSVGFEFDAPQPFAVALQAGFDMRVQCTTTVNNTEVFARMFYSLSDA